MSNGNTYLTAEEEQQRYLDQIRKMQSGNLPMPTYDEDDSSWLTDFAGNLLWGGTSSASWGLLDVGALTETGKDVRSTLALGTYKPWEEQTGAGKAGFVFGQGLGMFATFSWTGKGLGLVSRALSTGTGRFSTPRVATHIARKAGNEAVEKFGEKKANEALAKYGEKLLKGEVDDLAMEGLERGTLEAMREASKIVQSPGYKRLWKFNQEAYSTAVDDMSRRLITEMPDLGAEQALRLSDELISSAMKYSTHQFHNYMDGVVGLGAQWAAKTAPGVTPGAIRRGAEWTLTGKTGKLLSAMSTDAALGFVHHGAQATIENLAHKGGQLIGAEFNEQELKEYENLNSGFGEIVKHSFASGLWMSLIAPTRFIKGGRTNKLHKEALGGLNTLRKAWRPADSMGAEQARATLQLIDDVSEGALRTNILSQELAGKEIVNLTKDQAISMIKKVRKGFSNEWLKYMGNEMKEDLTGSAGRMIAGAIAMNLPAMHDYYEQTGKFDPVGSFGADTSEIVSNMIVGMLFAKSGRTFGEGTTSGKQSRLIETGEMKQYYTANIKKIKAVRSGLEMIGYRDRGNKLDVNEPYVELRGRQLVNSGEYRIVDDILRDKFVSSEDAPVIENALPLNAAFEKAVDTVANPKEQAKLEIAMKVIGHYDNNGTDIGNVMRHVTPSEAVDLVNRINEIPGIKQNKHHPEIWLRNALLNAGHTANERFYTIQLGNIRDFHESIGVRYDYDANTGVLRIPEIDGAYMNKLLGARPSETLSHLKSSYEKFVKEGQATGLVVVEGRVRDRKKGLNPNELKLLEKSYEDNVTLLNESSFGSDTMVYDKGLMYSENMWTSYKMTKAKIDVNNVLRMFTSVDREKLFTNLSETDFEMLDKELNKLQLNRSNLVELLEPAKTEAEHQRMETLTSFHSKVQNVHNILTGNKNLNTSGVKPVTLEALQTAYDKFFRSFGDVFTNTREGEATYQMLLNRSVDHMVNTLEIQSSHRENQLKQSLIVMMNGSVAPSGTSVGDIAKYGGLVQRREKQINIPDAQTLFETLKNTPELKGENLDGLQKYYFDFQEGMKAATGPINFTSNVNTVTELISKAGGATNVRNILVLAEQFSKSGHIKDLNNGYIKISEFIDKVASDRDIYMRDYSEMAGYDLAITDNLKKITYEMGTLQADIKHLIDTRDYQALIDIKLGEFASLTETLERFQKMDLKDVIDTKEGSIVDISYQQQLVDIINKARDLAGNRVLNSENISSYVNDQIANTGYDLYSREHVLRMNTTPQEFEGRYGLSTTDQEIIIDTALRGRTANSADLTNERIITAVNNLYTQAESKIAQRYIDDGVVPERLTPEQLYNEAWQLVSVKAFSDKINRAKYIGGYDGGMLIADQTAFPVQGAGDGRGLTGLKNIFFGTSEGWYQLQKDMKFLMQGEDVARDLVVLDKNVMSSVDSQLESGIGIESKTARNEYHRQVLERSLEEQIIPEKVPMVRVIFNDQTQIAVRKDLARNSIANAYREGGELSNIVRLLYGEARRDAADTFLERFRTPDLTIEVLKDGINQAWNILNMPHTIIAESIPRVTELDYMKRRKIADISKGKILDPRYHSALTDFYDNVYQQTGSDVARQFAESYRGMLNEDGILRNMRSISINDGGEEMSVIGRFRNRLDSYDEDVMRGIDRTNVESFVDGISKEVTDSPTFLSKPAFLRMLGTFAPNRELLQFNEQGDIVGFNVGSMKPKGVHISIDPDGSMTVSYDKTAFFYDPKVANLLESVGLDEVKFKSGNKINISREGYDAIAENYVEPITSRAGTKAESLEQMVEWTLEGARRRVIDGQVHEGIGVKEIPWSNYDLTQASVPHSGSVGANTGVHYSNRSGLNDWTGIDRHTNEFQKFFLDIQNSPEAATGIARSLSRMARDEGNLNPARTALDSFLDSQGIVVSDWMGDMVVDNLFSRYFQGSKIATREVSNSSYSPMAPFLADKNVDQPLLYDDANNIGRQRIYGGFGINRDIAEMPFKPMGISTERFPNGDRNKTVTGFFIARHKIHNPLTSETKEITGADGKVTTETDNISRSEFVVIPGEKKGEFVAIVEGLELTKEGKFIDVVNRDVKKLAPEQVRFNRDVYRAIERDIDGLREFWASEGLTNDMMLNKLAATDNMWMGILNVRQPRNAYDVIINKVHRESVGTEVREQLIPDKLRVKGEPYIKEGKVVYDVLVDMYEHPTRKDKTGDLVDIWVVDDLAQAKAQLAAIKSGLGGGTRFADTIVRHGDHYILRHRGGDHKEIYIRGTEPRGERVERWQHYDERQGNSTRQNALDVLRQDADHDFDKSNVYATAPKDFIKEVATMAGSKVTNDPIVYADLIIKQLHNVIGDQAGIREWFLDTNNTSALRGRFVKLHQIASYLSNALGEGGTLGTLRIDNKQVRIDMKSRKDYVGVVGDISKAVKHFLDNYKDVVDVRVDQNFARGIDKFVRDILFGTENIVKGERVSGFKGLFNFVAEGKNKHINQDVINGAVGGDLLAQTLYNQIISPLNRYLSYNRGELTQADIKSKITLKDVHRGWSDVKGSYDTRFDKDASGRYKEIDITDMIKLDLSQGKNTLKHFLETTSRNPFDMAMNSLSGAYDTGLKIKRHGGNRITDVEELILRGENDTLEKGDRLTYSRDVSSKIFRMVKNEGHVAKLSIISDKLSSLTGELAQLKASQYSNSYDIDRAARRVEYYAGLKKELEMLVSSKMAVERLENVFSFKNGRKEGTVSAFGQDWVVWNSKGKKIKQVIREGEVNQVEISPGDIIVRGGKNFEFNPPKRQDRLREKWIAYGKPMLEMVTGNGKMVSMNQMQYKGQIIPAYMDFTSQYSIVGRQWGQHRDGQRLSVDRKALLHHFLNDIGNRYGISDPLSRRALIFKLMTPEMDQNTYVVRERNGKFSYDFKLVENEKISKTVYSYLTDVKEQQSFSRDNAMTSIEADALIKELSRKAALSHYGLSDPYAAVDIPYTRTASYLSNLSKRLIDIDRNVLRPENVVQGQEHEFNNAITMINQFINGDRLITPFDMARMSKKIIGPRGSMNMFVAGEAGSSNPVLVRKPGAKGSLPKQTVDQLFTKLKERRFQCPE